LLPGGHISRAGYHLAKLQVGGASALSNAVNMIVKQAININLIIRSEYKWRGIGELTNPNAPNPMSYREDGSKVS